MGERKRKRWKIPNDGMAGTGLLILMALLPEILPTPVLVVGTAFGGTLILWSVGRSGWHLLKKKTSADNFGSIAIIGLICSVLFVGIYSKREWLQTIFFPREVTAQDVARELGGGDNFCYFHAALGHSQQGGYKWRISNKEQRPIPDIKMCGFKIVGDEQKFLGCWSGLQMCVPETVDQRNPIGKGKFRFKFNSANSWEQFLEISEQPGVVTQLITIFRNGKEIWRRSDSHSLKKVPDGTR